MILHKELLGTTVSRGRIVCVDKYVSFPRTFEVIGLEHEKYRCVYRLWKINRSQIQVGSFFHALFLDRSWDCASDEWDLREAETGIRTNWVPATANPSLYAAAFSTLEIKEPSSVSVCENFLYFVR